jgi:Fe-S-cluster containining protein
MDTPPNDAEGQQDICQSCGMCCDGTLFGRTRLNPPVVNPKWPSHVIRSISGDGILKQPCSAFQNGLCGIYTSRPKVCQEFECKLLEEYASGAITSDEALEIIRNTKNFRSDFVEAIAKVIPEPERATPNAWYRKFKNVFENEFDSAEFKRAHARLLLLFARLKHELNTRFYEPQPERQQIAAGTKQTNDVSGISLIRSRSRDG